MSTTNALQRLIFERLVADTAVHAICADRIYDNVPDAVEFPYVSFGPITADEADAECIDGIDYVVQIDCWSREQGRRATLNALCDTVRRSLHEYHIEPASGALVEMRVTNFRVFRDPDNITMHGVIQVTAMMEE